MFDLFFGTPMFDPQVSVNGMPLSALLLAAGFVLLVAGFVWMRRISSVDGDPRSFRATTRPSSLDRLVRGVALATVVFAAVFAVATLATH